MILSSRSIAVALVLTFAASSEAAGIPKPPDWGKVKNHVARMRNGNPRVRNPDSPAETKTNKEEIKIVAEYLAYTIATPPYNGEPVPNEDKTPAFIDRSMNALMKEVAFYTSMPVTTGNSGRLTVEQTEYGEEMGAALAAAAKVVLENSTRPIERVNAVRLMSLAARMPAPDLVAPFLEMIASQKVSDAEKLYAFQGLRNLMEQTDLIDPTRHVIRDVNVLGQISETLAAYIFQDRLPRDEREKAVIEYVRRHAVMALAQFKFGVIRKPNKDLISRPSWSLMRVIANDPTVSPPFTVQEKIEAAIGFCQQKIDPDMNLDVAAFNLAGVTVPGVMFEFSKAANEDIIRAKRDGTLPGAQWKVLAARLSYAMSVWREACKPLPAPRSPQNVVTLADASIALLTPIEKEGGGAATGAQVGALTKWSTNYPPKAWQQDPPKPAQLYTDDPKSLLPFAAPAKKAPDPKLSTPAVPPAKGPVPKVVNPKKGTPPAK